MKVDKLTLRFIFDTTERLEAPLFQRPYVWKRDRNWEPLWESLKPLADERTLGKQARPHFLGTIVLDQIPTLLGRVHARQIIDGQQRLTTLQLALAAARDVCADRGENKLSSAFGKLTKNDSALSDDPLDQFKVWPTNADQDDFKDVMSCSAVETVRRLQHADPKDEWLIPDAYLYFADTFSGWLGAEMGDAFKKRAEALYYALTEDVHVVVINLEKDDDAQEIFETLNHLGTPLQAADLVKNFLFHKAEREKLDSRKLYEQHWRTFDTEKGYWRREVRQGRLKRPRVDLFLYHYLALMTGEDTPAAQTFSAYRKYVEAKHGQNPAQHMEHFRSYADVFRSFDEFKAESRGHQFFYRLRQLDTATVYPLLLEVLKRRDRKAEDRDLDRVFVDLESFLVRRAVCGLTAKNYNKLFLDLTNELVKSSDFSSAAIRTFLRGQESDISRWPDDKEFGEAWVSVLFYKRVKKSTTRMVLEALEAALFDPKSEKVRYAEKLSVEHLMPQDWKKHWPLPNEDDERAVKVRKETLQRIGNLTLLNKKLNSSVSNGPWERKREKILDHSALNLNRRLPKKWDEEAIQSRSEELRVKALKIWPHS